MIQDTIAQIEQKLAEVNTLTPEARRELVQLLETLNQQIATLSASTIPPATTTTASNGESDLTPTNGEEPELLDAAVNKVRKSVEGFENTHPRVVEAINRIATTLAGLGI